LDSILDGYKMREKCSQLKSPEHLADLLKEIEEDKF
jgi:hypothetical protein